MLELREEKTHAPLFHRALLNKGGRKVQRNEQERQCWNEEQNENNTVTMDKELAACMEK